jgi:RNA polymerase sigma-70 factor (ECF subfamily)
MMSAAAPDAGWAEDDAAAIARVLGGDTGAFRVLVERYQARVLQLVRGLAPRSSAHEDIAQEAFVSAFVALPSFDPQRGRFASWLFTIAKNNCFNALKRKAPWPLADAHEPVAATTPADELANADARRRLDAALDALPDGLRSAFVLMELVGLSAEQIAEMDDVAAGTIRSRLSRAKAALRAALSPLRGEES